MEEMDLIIEEDGTIRFVYSDALAEVFAGERQETRRASHVEPAADYERFDGLSGWVADMRPSGGPILLDPDDGRAYCAQREGGYTFKTRQKALDAERAWLRDNEGL